MALLCIRRDLALWKEAIMARKIVHYDWIYETLRPSLWQQHESDPRQERVREAVQRELERLTFDEREFVELYWFQGKSTQEIGELLGRKPYKLEGLNKRIIRKLRNRLAEFVRKEFELEIEAEYDCGICEHKRRREIDKILLAKKPEETYRRIIGILKNEFGISIKTPQVIIGHIKYHTKEE
jgi:DNA-binding CsgD family transcriptional regulator